MSKICPECDLTKCTEDGEKDFVFMKQKCTFVSIVFAGYYERKQCLHVYDPYCECLTPKGEHLGYVHKDETCAEQGFIRNFHL